MVNDRIDQTNTNEKVSEPSCHTVFLSIFLSFFLSSTLVYYFRRYGILSDLLPPFFVSLSFCWIAFYLPTVFYFPPTLICIIPPLTPERNTVVNNVFFPFLFLYSFIPLFLFFSLFFGF